MDAYFSQIEKENTTMFKALCKIRYAIGKSAEELQQIADEAMEIVSKNPFETDIEKKEEAA